ncbi:SUN domain-containing ossification factor like [Actinidia chinensis var. chinensis]|uniref:SUN domain-containing ossification factor like n=1 Tax=Actinidia chinensis var. chinensis TaxID=1590841 RepID=A0A2R6P486_ACTCC|nr:SUN domain-containing ossification factor like [Actinidia chinensis var. chinensis]
MRIWAVRNMVRRVGVASSWECKISKEVVLGEMRFTRPTKAEKEKWWKPADYTLDEDEIVMGSSIKGSSDYSCASSVTYEEGYGTRPVELVARLMGLDSLPTSNLQEDLSTPFIDSQSVCDAHHHRRNFESRHDRQITHSGNLHKEVEFPVQKATESKPHRKTMNRPIEKFQTEILPPKSIPITHLVLLSPIKSPGFITSKNAAHIMEAAVKIIEPGPQVSNKAKMPLLGNSSGPFKVRDLKEKAEAAQKASRTAEASSSMRRVETNAAKFLKGQSVNKSLNGLVDTTSFRVSYDLEVFSCVRDKGKSVSLALQAKVNVQRKGRFKPKWWQYK